MPKSMKNMDVTDAEHAEMIASDDECMCPQCGYKATASEFNSDEDMAPEGRTESERAKGKNEQPASEIKKRTPKDMALDLMGTGMQVR